MIYINEKLEQERLERYNQFYLKEPLREINMESTIYQQIFNLNKNNMHYNAIGFLGKNITYEQLKKKVDLTASALVRLGVKKGDVVPVSLLNVPEAPIMLLALSKIGAISKWLDIRYSSENYEKAINEHGSNKLILLSNFATEVDKIIKNTDVDNVLTVEISDSLTIEKKIAYKLKNALSNQAMDELKNESKFNKFSKIVNDYGTLEYLESSKYEENATRIILQSSGTTGVAKSMEHTETGVNKFLNGASSLDIPFEPKKTLLTIAPPFVAYGLVNSLLFPLTMGMKADLCPITLANKVILKNVKKGKANFYFATPTYYREVMDDVDKIDKNKLKVIDAFISGGDKINIEELENIEKKLGVKVNSGYGSSEGLGAVTCNSHYKNKYGTVGIPKKDDDIVIWDFDKNKEVNAGEVGEVLYRTGGIFKKYTNLEDETNEVRISDQHGRVWCRTSDLGKFDDDGFLIILGRTTRVITRKSYQIAPSEIENIISTHPDIKLCSVVAAPEKYEGEVPMVFYTKIDESNKTYEELNKELEALCSSLKSNMIPLYYQCVENIPHTEIGKIDFRKLEELAKVYVENLEEKEVVKSKIKKKLV